MNTIALLQQGLEEHHAGRLDAAARLYSAALADEPENISALRCLGVLRSQQGDSRAALGLLQAAARFAPDVPEIFNDLGNALHQSGALDDAVLALSEALRLSPAFLEAGLMLGRTYRDLGRWAEAEQVYRDLARSHPRNGEVHLHLGTCQLALRKFEAAAESCTHALALTPDVAEAHFKVGVAHLHLFDIDRAIRHLTRATELKPDNVNAALQLAIALRRSGAFEEAGAAFQRACSLAPANADVHWNYADLLLLLGDYRRGWDEFEWRWQHERFLTPRLQFPQPQWNGEPISGKTILLHPEQGFGDTLQFVRYVPLVAARGARVLLGSPPELARLFAGFPGTEGVYLSPALVPAFDVHCPLLSLPRIFGTTVDTIPSQLPYVNVNPSVGRHWTEYFARYAGTLNVGLIWSGNPGQENNSHRACRIADLLRLFGINNISFFSLQKGSPSSELGTLGENAPVIDLSSRLGDFAETAAVMQQLDLLISTDTGPVHLAGALGRRVWLLLSAIPDWRWMTAREDSPWYPGMRLFRQTRLGVWTDVVDRVATALAALVAGNEFPRKRQGSI